MIITALPDTPDHTPADSGVLLVVSYREKCAYRVALNILGRDQNTRNRSETINRIHHG